MGKKDTVEKVEDSRKEILVVRCKNTVHTGVRRRAGFVFDDKPLAVEVTPEQKKMIEEDKYLIVVQAGNSIEQGIERMNRDKDQAATREQQAEAKTAVQEPSEPTADPKEETGEEGKVEDPAKDPTQEKTTVINDSTLSRMKNTDIVKELEKKGLLAGEDFDPNAKKQDLIDLYKGV